MDLDAMRLQFYNLLAWKDQVDQVIAALVAQQNSTPSMMEIRSLKKRLDALENPPEEQKAKKKED